MKNSNALAINVCNLDRKSADKAATKFSDAGRVSMGEGNYLVWHFDIGLRNMSWMYDAKNETSDFGWILEDIGTTLEVPRRKEFALRAGWREDAFRYMVVADYGDEFFDDFKKVDFNQMDELFDELLEIGVRIRMSSYGNIVIESNQKLTFKARALFGKAFDWAELVELKEDTEIYEIQFDIFKPFVEGIIVGYQHICKDTGTYIDQDLRRVRDMDISPRTMVKLERKNITILKEVIEASKNEFKGCNLQAYEKQMVNKSLEYYTSIPKPFKNVPGVKKFDAMDELESLIGLEGVKNQVKRIRAYAKMKQANPVCAASGMSLNMVFKGNPGTCKTTVARVLAKIFFELGILESSNIVEVGRSGLVGRYIGSTAIRVRETFEKASGKLLFIDEAYSLAEQDHDGYGQEAISTIIQEMENRRDKTVVIFAGYPEQMDEFLKSNPGLKSRVPFEISFNDYSSSEMFAIAEHEAIKRGFKISPEAKSRVMTLISSYGMEPDSGNGRFVRNLVENAIMNYACRFYGEDVSYEAKNDFVLLPEDFTYDSESSSKAREYRIGFDVA